MKLKLTLGILACAFFFKLSASEKNTLKFLKDDMGNIFSIEKPLPSKAIPNIEKAEQNFYSFIQTLSSYTAIEPTSRYFRILKKNVDKNGNIHLRGQQYYHNIPIFGGDFNYHIRLTNEKFVGNLFPEPNTKQANISESGALECVLANLQKDREDVRVFEKESVYFPFKDELRLAYRFHLYIDAMRSMVYFIDAQNKEILFSYESTLYSSPNGSGTTERFKGKDYFGIEREINAYKENDTLFLINTSESMFDSANFKGYIALFDANFTNIDGSFGQHKPYIKKAASEEWKDSVAFTVSNYSSEIYKYYDTVLGLKSYDGKGGNLSIIIRGGTNTGEGLDNSLWYPENFMVLGYGDTLFHDFARSKDIIGHEFGHGIVMNHTNLVYSGPSGAIHETYADIFGVCAEGLNWTIGENSIKDTLTYPNKSMRNMENPNNGGKPGDFCWQPKHYSEVGVGPGVSMGVHTNSGIGNRVFYLTATEMGRGAAVKIFFNALKDYMNVYSSFIPFREACVSAATDLHGENSAEVEIVKKAFSMVGIEETWLNEGITPIALINKQSDIYTDSTLLIKARISLVIPNEGYFVQDGDSAYSGIFVSDTSQGISAMYLVKLRGIVDRGRENIRFIKDWNDIPKLSNTIKAKLIQIEDIGLAYHAMLITLNDLICTQLPENGYWTAEIDDFTIKINQKLFDYTPVLNKKYNISGILRLQNGEYYIIPRSAVDIEEQVNICPDKEIDKSFSLYPNPSKGSFTLKGENMKQLVVYSINGKQILKQNINRSQTDIHLPTQNKGIYIIELEMKNGERSYQKLVVN